MKTLLLSAIAFSTAFFTSDTQGAEWEHFNQAGCDIPSNAVTTLHTNDSGIWVGTEDGLAHFDGSVWTQFNTDNSPIPSNEINDVHVDAQGALWIATYNGLAVYRNRVWQVFTAENSLLPSNLVRSVTSDATGAIWLGTWGGGLAKFEANTWTVFNTVNSSLPNNGIYTVEVDDENRVWAGTFAGGVAMLEFGTWTVFNTSNSALPNNHVRSIVFETDNSAWFGTDNGLAHLAMDGEMVWNIYTSLYFGHGVQSFRDATKDVHGALWFATDGGLLRYEDGNFHFKHTQNSGIAHDNAAAVAVDNRGNVFVGLAHHGLSVFNPEGVALALSPHKTQLNMEVWPNPTTDALIIKIPLKGDGVQVDISIVDIAGKTMLRSVGTPASSGTMHQQALDVSSLPTGIYLLTLRTEEGIASLPFVKL